jgi:hypothetical protein
MNMKLLSYCDIVFSAYLFALLIISLLQSVQGFVTHVIQWLMYYFPIVIQYFLFTIYFHFPQICFIIWSLSFPSNFCSVHATL